MKTLTFTVGAGELTISSDHSGCKDITYKIVDGKGAEGTKTQLNVIRLIFDAHTLNERRNDLRLTMPPDLEYLNLRLFPLGLIHASLEQTVTDMWRNAGDVVDFAVFKKGVVPGTPEFFRLEFECC